ncbi:MAG: uroporphyrinogen-III C-methyltransferase [Candidatus Melainabacteria bacterium]|nr:MAG: uroporphyrinogen-III C-methyltransferase [Candidatus Melainabacteria bacterium]
MATGKVFLIGAGPGDLELLTLKAVKALSAADVILIDDLVNQEILQFAKPGAPVIRVGKRGGGRSTPQIFISKQMISLASEGKCVARVKGGDPLIFARTHEELKVLSEYGIEVSIVNGITAGLAAPATLGIPLTNRDYAHSITFVTGRSRESAQPNWRALVESGSTLVIYMGMRTLHQIVERLIKAGMPPTMPAAVVEQATLAEERSLITSLSELPKAVLQSGMASPAVIIVGKVIEDAAALKETATYLSGSGRLP